MRVRLARDGIRNPWSKSARSVFWQCCVRGNGQRDRGFPAQPFGWVYARRLAFQKSQQQTDAGA